MARSLTQYDGFRHRELISNFLFLDTPFKCVKWVLVDFHMYLKIIYYRPKVIEKNYMRKYYVNKKTQSCATNYI